MSKKSIVIFISGSGSNMESLIRAALDEDYPARIIGVISDKPQAGGLEKAKNYGIPTFAVDRRDYNSKAEHEAAFKHILDDLQPDFICLAGFMRLLSADFVAHYNNKILNIHPSLLPLFPGLHTHQAAIDAGMKIAGCTVHLVTAIMDEGPILGQAAVPVLENDTAESLAARILTVEHQLYPAVVARFISQKGASAPSQQIISY